MEIDARTTTRSRQFGEKAKNVVSVVREQAEERCQKLKNEVDEMRSESFVLQSSVLRESELTELADVQGAREAQTFEQAARGSEGRVPGTAQRYDGSGFNCVKAEASRGSNGLWNPYSRNTCGEKCSHFFSRQAACQKQVMTHAFKEKGLLHEEVDLLDPETVCPQTTSESTRELELTTF